MIFDTVVNAPRAESTRDTRTPADPTGWRVGGKLFGGKTTQAMKLSAVSACIEVISDSMAKMPVHLMDVETRERINGHPAVRLLMERPNEAMNPFTYGKLVEVRRLTEGNSHVLILRNRWAEPVELVPIAPGCMLPYFDDAGRLWYIGTNPRTGERRRFWPDDILHYKAFSTDGINGISVLTRAAQTIEAALAAQAYEGSFYRNNAQLSGVLQTDADLSGKEQKKEDGTVAPSAKDKIRAEWARIHSGADNAFRIAVLDHGLKYTPISANNKDAQFIESRAVSVEDISRFFGVPSYKLNTGKQSYSSNEQNAIEYLVKTLHPIVAQYEQEDTHRLILQTDARHRELRRNMMGELRGDWKTRGDWFTTMRNLGAYSVNDILALEDMPNVPGGDVRLGSLNYVPLDLFRELSVQRNGGQKGEGK